MATFFEKIRIGNLELNNRIIMAPMTRSRADDQGLQPDYAAEYYAQRASGGLLITEAANISPMAKGYVRTPGIFTPQQIEAWKPVAKAVHSKGGRVFMQIFHTGRIALPDFLPDGQLPVAPSTVKAKGQNYTDAGMKEFVEPRALTTKEVKEIVRNFADAAKNAIAAGFDGVELHSASGYLVHQFLMKPVNLRTDEYGGSIKNRARFLFEILDAMSEAVGAGRVGVKFSPSLPFNDIQEPDADEVYSYIFKELGSRKIAYVHVSDGANAGWHAKLRPLYDGLYFAGANFTRELGEEYLTENKADAIVYGVKFLANPDLPDRFAKKAELNTPDAATFYSPGKDGYLDYPIMAKATAG